MIRESNEMQHFKIDELRGGRGAVEFIKIFDDTEMAEKCRLFAKIMVPVGASIGMHAHVNEEEIYYILSGFGRINDNGNVKELKQGDASITGNTGEGELHSIENTGDEPLELLAAVLLY
jgi:mannose-6-phosphate isomerase-like protein (cupin superfamily)